MAMKAPQFYVAFFVLAIERMSSAWDDDLAGWLALYADTWFTLKYSRTVVAADDDDDSGVKSSAASTQIARSRVHSLVV
uniref:Putative secreted protein n=1 Tax=Anopheles darlingi TaxID=43151 RepID=A0A2M4DAS4_ANODA